MPSDSPSQGGRRHFHRGRRGQDRRGGDRRGTPGPQPQQPQQQAIEQGPRADQVDVEQIMREIRAKIAQRHGVELTDQQVQELAARRLESILDPRTIKPSLLDQLRRSAGARPDTVAAADRASVPYEFEDTTLYDSPSGLTRFIRKLLNPILKLFFNPNPLIRALHVQAQLNVEAARREAERDQRQAEWNALHYEILQRVVSEIAKVSLEVQSLSLRVESLSAKVDFNDRRVRGIEGAVNQARPGAGRERDREGRDRDHREREREAPQPVISKGLPADLVPATAEPATAAAATAEAPSGDAPRRRRRRRRGRRGGGLDVGAPASMPAADALDASAEANGDEVDEGEVEAIDTDPIVTPGVEAIIQLEDDVTASVGAETPAAPERIAPQPASPEPAVREEAAPDLPAPAATLPEPEPHEPR